MLIIHLRRGDGGVERIPTTVAKITLADVEAGVMVRQPVCQKNVRPILRRCLYRLPFHVTVSARLMAYDRRGHTPHFTRIDSESPPISRTGECAEKQEFPTSY